MVLALRRLKQETSVEKLNDVGCSKSSKPISVRLVEGRNPNYPFCFVILQQQVKESGSISHGSRFTGIRAFLTLAFLYVKAALLLTILG